MALRSRCRGSKEGEFSSQPAPPGDDGRGRSAVVVWNETEREEVGQAMAKFNPGKFVREVRQETGKVTWPTFKETRVTTIMVLIMVAILSLFFLGVDQVLGRTVQFLLDLAR
jgi:preprotein translocase subunit SecE